MMAFAPEEIRLFKQGLSTAHRQLGDIRLLIGDMATAHELTPELTRRLGSIGLPELFALESPPTFREAQQHREAVQNQLAKNRAGRLGQAASEVTDLLAEMEKTPSLDPSTDTFWVAFFRARENEDASALDGFAAQLAAGYGIIRMILRSELVRRLQANALGHVPLDQVTRRLSYRGIVMLEDLPKPTIEAVRATGVNVVQLLRPTGADHPRYTLGIASSDTISVQELTVDDLEAAVTWCDQRGADKSTWKKALTALRSAVEPDNPLDAVLTTYHLQLVEEQRNQGTFAASIRASLVAAGLDSYDAARLLNEQAAAPAAYPWGGPEATTGYNWTRL